MFPFSHKIICVWNMKINIYVLFSGWNNEKIATDSRRTSLAKQTDHNTCHRSVNDEMFYNFLKKF